MKKVITYGTFDLLHFGHVNVLQNAKKLGDYLIVGITSDDFDKRRGKLNVKQSLSERIDAVKKLGIADEIIVEEYEGQKIDDIKKYDVDIFTVGSDWVGKFDYLNEFCKVMYLPRTEGISSTQQRNANSLRLGIVGEVSYIHKYVAESKVVNGLELVGICAKSTRNFPDEILSFVSEKAYEDFLDDVDAVYVASQPKYHFEQISLALKKGKHVLCESPIALTQQQCTQLFDLAKQSGCILMESIKTAYSVAYSRLLLLAKMGEIGDVVSIDATCTSLMDKKQNQLDYEWKSLYAWGPTAMLPVFQLLGTNFVHKNIATAYIDKKQKFDAFTNVNFIYKNAVANVKVGKGVKSEGELIISGIKGYIYVPAPWWKTDYFEIRYEDSSKNKRFFYQLEGEGIRHQFVTFVKSIELGLNVSYIDNEISQAIAGIVQDFEDKKDLFTIEI
ncbi:MAG: adenylyltransferase/cytidyltransferase family protein [Clostridia bacterium]|nr:adenylyltransferase/cytidyltransferase family protein [Clostridia bacterium]